MSFRLMAAVLPLLEDLLGYDFTEGEFDLLG